MTTNARSCPVSGIKADETVVRLIAAQVVILLIVATVGQSFILSAIIALDFAARAFGFGQFSLLKTVAKAVKSAIGLKSKMTDEAPKVFAARIGFFVIVAVTVSQVLNWTFVSLSLGAMIVTFATLESVLGVCVGCILYNSIYRFRQA